MKKYLTIAVFALLASASSLSAIEHNLQRNGIAAEVISVYEKAENRASLPPIVKTYYDRVQKGQYDISIEDLQKLHEELCNIQAANGRRQI